MEYINDININEAVIHVLDSNAGEPILNEYSLDLNEEAYKFIFKHIEKCFKDDELKYAKFNYGRSIVKEVTEGFLNGIENDLINISKGIAKQLFAIMNGNINIPSCDLIVASIVTDQGPMIAILKLDYVKNFTHKIDFDNQKIAIGITPQAAGLPSSGQKIEKAAFIKPYREHEKYNLMVLDKKKVKEDEYGANYWYNNFLNCHVITNERDNTRMFLEGAEVWTRENFSEDAEQATKIRNKVKQVLQEEEDINIHEFANEIFKHEDNIASNFKTFMSGKIEEEFEVDKVYTEKKLKKRKLKIDRDITIQVEENIYNDPSKFEIIKNGDGSVNISIKNVKSIIEK